MNVIHNGKYLAPWPARAFWALAALSALIIVLFGAYLYHEFGPEMLLVLIPWLMTPLLLAAIAAVIDLLGGIQFQLIMMRDGSPIAAKNPVAAKAAEAPKKKKQSTLVESNRGPISLVAVRKMQEKYDYPDSWWTNDSNGEFLAEEPVTLDEAVKIARDKDMFTVHLMNVETPQNWHEVDLR